MEPVSSKEFLDIQATIECEFTLKRVRDMIRTYKPFEYLKCNILATVNVNSTFCFEPITPDDILQQLQQVSTKKVAQESNINMKLENVLVIS